MNPVLRKSLIGAVLASGLAAIVALDPTGRVFNVPGLLLVVVGTLAAATLGQSLRELWVLMRALPSRLSRQSFATEDEVDLELLLKALGFLRQGNIRYAELAVRRIGSPLLQSGALLVLDRVPAADLQRMLQWRVATQRERDQAEIQVFQNMMNLAPAFGMVGTLFGLIGMLYGLDMSHLKHLGAEMGFAMLTTVYGLLLTNLVLKPIVTRLERRSRERLAWLNVQQEVVMMMNDQAHPGLIRQYVMAFRSQASSEVPWDGAIPGEARTIA